MFLLLKVHLLGERQIFMKFEINVTKEDLATKKPLLTAIKRLFPTAHNITQGEYHDLDCTDSYAAIDIFSYAGFISIYKAALFKINYSLHY